LAAVELPPHRFGALTILMIAKKNGRNPKKFFGFLNFFLKIFADFASSR
jgi:hypothetical protein